jgi:hypothetical protein
VKDFDIHKRKAVYYQQMQKIVSDDGTQKAQLKKIKDCPSLFSCSITLVPSTNTTYHNIIN